MRPLAYGIGERLSHLASWRDSAQATEHSEQ
jgi:hypothetical protein